jgi:ribosomal protein S18 acetylase RimI-like enzyme
MVAIAALMKVAAREAGAPDVSGLLGLYRELEAEMVALHYMWPLADGLPEPAEEALRAAISDPRTLICAGTIDEVPVGFLLATVESLLPQAEGEEVGSIRLVFVTTAAREVGVGEAMRDLALERFRSRGLRRFDAHVLPGHRLAKNFFEAGGFAARSIIMHHAD